MERAEASLTVCSTGENTHHEWPIRWQIGKGFIHKEHIPFSTDSVMIELLMIIRKLATLECVLTNVSFDVRYMAHSNNSYCIIDPMSLLTGSHPFRCFGDGDGTDRIFRSTMSSCQHSSDLCWLARTAFLCLGRLQHDDMYVMMMMMLPWDTGYSIHSQAPCIHNMA